MFCGKSMAIAFLLTETCDCLKLVWKTCSLQHKGFLLLLLHQVIVLDFSRLTNVIIDFIHFSDSRHVVFNMYHLSEKQLRLSLDLLLWIQVDLSRFFASWCKDVFIILNTNQLLFDKNIISFKLSSV